MDRFVQRTKRVAISEPSVNPGSASSDTINRDDTDGHSQENEKSGTAPSTSSVKKRRCDDSSRGYEKIRQYSEDYLSYGFASNGSVPPLPLCVVCNETLSNHSMKPSLLKRHLETKHPNLKQKSVEYFKKMRESVRKGSIMLAGFSKSSEKALQASYEISQLIAKKRKPHTVFEELIFPAAIKIAEIMMDKRSIDTIKTIPRSNDTVSRRISEMAQDVVQQICEQIKCTKKFSIQIDESTDVSNDAQVMIFVRYVDREKGLTEQILGCKTLSGKTTGQEIFRCLSECLDANGLEWTWCTSVCTDGAASMKGYRSGFVAFVKERNPEVQWRHCIIHRQALASKQLSSALNDVLNIVVKAVNFIKSRALNSRLFRLLCQDMGSEHLTLLLHTEVRWLSRGRVLNRVFELRHEIYIFLKDREFELQNYFLDEGWLCKIAYLSDFFGKMNELNLQLQGRGVTIFSTAEKVRGFYKKLIYWRKRCEEDVFVQMPVLAAFADENNINLPKSDLKDIIINHLRNVADEFLRYFPEIEENGNDKRWITNPFSEQAISEASCSEIQKEKLFELSSESIMQDNFKAAGDVAEFWHSIRHDYPQLSATALTALLPFSSTYLSESGFSALTAIKSKDRNRLSPESDVILAVTSLDPRIPLLMSSKQAQRSH